MKIYRNLSDLFTTLELDTNPTCLKQMMQMWNLPSGGHRLPLSPPCTNHIKIIKETLLHYDREKPKFSPSHQKLLVH